MAETKGETGDCEMLRGSETENELNIACMTAENVSEVRVNIWGDDEDGCLTEQVLRLNCSFFFLLVQLADLFHITFIFCSLVSSLPWVGDTQCGVGRREAWHELLRFRHCPPLHDA